jgi:hypothetical protein
MAGFNLALVILRDYGSLPQLLERAGISPWGRGDGRGRNWAPQTGRVRTGMMVRARTQQASAGRGLVVALLLAGAAILAGCSSGGVIGDYAPTAVGGLPEGTPQRPTKSTAYPAVHDMPPPREQTPLSDAEQKRLEDDLVAARKRTTDAAAPR